MLSVIGKNNDTPEEVRNFIRDLVHLFNKYGMITRTHHEENGKLFSGLDLLIAPLESGLEFHLGEVVVAEIVDSEDIWLVEEVLDEEVMEQLMIMAEGDRRL